MLTSFSLSYKMFENGQLFVLYTPAFAFVTVVFFKDFPEIKQKRSFFESLRFVSQPILASWLR
jgi:hypothetical protein